MDQKVTPDVLCIIADCIINFLDSHQDKTLEFTVKDIWDFDYFNGHVRLIFSKPDANEETAKREYDKFIGQPLKMLAYAHILESRKEKKQNVYKVNNYDILEFISHKEQNAYKFIIAYLIKVLQDSGLIREFEEFRVKNIQSEFHNLKDRYINFIINNTRINKKTEASRIFTKVLNPYAAFFKIHGTKDGRLSSSIISYSDLLYNQPNWRDKGKEKHQTRKQHRHDVSDSHNKSHSAYNDYNIEKAKRILKRMHCKSEVDDQLALGEATHVHHIFMKSEFPAIAAYVENLILLTPSQHLTKAHPGNNTNIIDKDYQLLCLLSKAKTIEIHMRNQSYSIYSKENFLTVVNTGLHKQYPYTLPFSKIKHNLVALYNSG